MMPRQSPTSSAAVSAADRAFMLDALAYLPSSSSSRASRIVGGGD